jgi:lipopolysaccharide transport system permease protein
MNMTSYLKYLCKTRYFWWHLTCNELTLRYRRSKLGLLWVLLNPLMMALIIAAVFGAVFGMPMEDYAPYILSGIIVWELLCSSIVTGSSFLMAEQYIRQFNHPPTIYTLKSSLVFSINFLIALTGLFVWILVMTPFNSLMGLALLPLNAVLFLLLSWPLTTIASYMNAKYRDYPQTMLLIMQALYFVSPVFLQEGMFRATPALLAWFQVNPVTHMLDLFRRPLLHGQWPTLENYGVMLLCVLICTILAWLVDRLNRRELIYYL